VTAVAEAPDRAGVLQTWSRAPAAAKAMLVGTFVNRLGAFFQTFLVLFLTHRGFSPVQAGVALGVYGLGGLLGVLTGGALADRLGVRTATLLSMAGSGVLLIGVLYVRSLPVLLVVVALVGLAAQLYRPASATLLAQVTPESRRVMVFALYRWALNLGTTIAPLLGALLVAISYDLLFWAEAAAAGAFALIAVVTLPRATPGDSKPADEEPRGGYRDVLRDRRYVCFLLATALNSLVYLQYVAALPLAMHDAGLATAWFSGVVALNGFLVITCELLVTKLTQRLPARRVVSVGFFLLGAGFTCYALPLGLAAFVVGTIVWTSAEIVGGPTMFAYPGFAAPAHLRGRYVAAMQVMFALGGTVGPALGVLAYHQLGGSLWWFCGAACAVALLLGRVAMAPNRASTGPASPQPVSSRSSS
jgi:predicted MFS family arabinose efflux permease